MNSNPQLDVILKTAPYYENCLPLPCELLMKIFHDVVRISDDPIRDLCNIAHVCETWRQIVLSSPSLWSRFNFNQIPITDNNLKNLAKIVDRKPTILFHINEISIRGQVLAKDIKSTLFLDQIISAPNLKELHIDELDSRSKNGIINHIARAIGQCRGLKKLSIKNTRQLVGQQKWLADHLLDNGKQLEELHLTSSISAVSSQLFRAIASDYCPMLRVLDISTCDFINTRSFDAIQLVQNMPNLEILRVANVSFKRVYNPPEVPGLKKLEELSMPIGMRDAERDDALLATLTYGSNQITTLDLRGSSITANALENMPSFNLRELHIDDICPITRRLYHRFINKWRHSLENDEDYENISKPHAPIVIKELDLESSDVEPQDLRKFLNKAKFLQAINLSSCRSLPRGCKGRYAQAPTTKEGKINDLKQRLGSNHTDSETEIDEENNPHNNVDGFFCRPKKRLRTRTKRPDYICDF